MILPTHASPIDRFELDSPDSIAGRVIAAVDECCARWGVAKTTIEDIARQAGVSRATVYRAFPGGREAIFEAYRRREVIDFFLRLESAFTDAETLDDTIVAALHTSACQLADDVHLATELATDPGHALQSLTSRGVQRIFSACRAFIAPHFEPWLPRSEAERVAELCARLVLTYYLEPSEVIDLTDRPTVERLVATRVIPGLALRDSKIPSMPAC